jgi:hypothetical protein
MSMDDDRPMSPAAFRSMRRTSRPHPTGPVGQVCFRDVKNSAGVLSVVQVDHVKSCHDQYDHVKFDCYHHHPSH